VLYNAGLNFHTSNVWLKKLYIVWNILPTPLANSLTCFTPGILLTTQIAAFRIWHAKLYQLQLSYCACHHCPSGNNPPLFISCQL